MDEYYFFKALADRFTASELIDYLDISVEDVIRDNIDAIRDSREDLEEIMKYGR